MGTKVSLIIPTLNEEENLNILLSKINKSEIKKYIYEIIIVDGYSTDNTVDIAKKFKTKIIYDKIGKGSALRKGLKEAKGDILITLDADCSHGIEEIEPMINTIKSGFDVCMGSRFMKGGRTKDMTPIRMFGNKFFLFLVNLIWGTNYTDLCYGYRALKKSVVNEFDLKSNGFDIETEISIKCAKKKLRVLELPSFEEKRRIGNSRLKIVRDGICILKRILIELIKK